MIFDERYVTDRRVDALLSRIASLTEISRREENELKKLREDAEAHQRSAEYVMRGGRQVGRDYDSAKVRRRVQNVAFGSRRKRRTRLEAIALKKEAKTKHLELKRVKTELKRLLESLRGTVATAPGDFDASGVMERLEKISNPSYEGKKKKKKAIDRSSKRAPSTPKFESVATPTTPDFGRDVRYESAAYFSVPENALSRTLEAPLSTDGDSSIFGLSYISNVAGIIDGIASRIGVGSSSRSDGSVRPSTTTTTTTTTSAVSDASRGATTPASSSKTIDAAVSRDHFDNAEYVESFRSLTGSTEKSSLPSPIEPLSNNSAYTPISPQEREEKRMLAAARRALRHEREGGLFNGLDADEAAKVGAANNMFHVDSKTAKVEPNKQYDPLPRSEIEKRRLEAAARRARRHELEAGGFGGLVDAVEALKIGESNNTFRSSPPAAEDDEAKDSGAPIELISSKERERRELELASHRAEEHVKEGGGFDGLRDAREALAVGTASNYVAPEPIALDLTVDFLVEKPSSMSKEELERLNSSRREKAKKMRERLRARHAAARKNVAGSSSSSNSGNDATESVDDDVRTKEVEGKTSETLSSTGGHRFRGDEMRDLQSRLAAENRKAAALRMQIDEERERTTSSSHTADIDSKEESDVPLDTTSAFARNQKSAYFEEAPDTTTSMSTDDVRSAWEDDKNAPVTPRASLRLRALNAKERARLKMFQSQYGRDVVGAKVDPLEDERTVVNSSNFHLKVLGMSPMASHPEPFSGVRPPRAGLWELLPTENVSVSERDTRMERFLA